MWCHDVPCRLDSAIADVSDRGRNPSALDSRACVSHEAGIAMADTMRTEESIMIARPIADVFTYISNPDNAADWNGNVVDYTLESGKADEVGAVTSFAVKVA